MNYPCCGCKYEGQDPTDMPCGECPKLSEDSNRQGTTHRCQACDYFSGILEFVQSFRTGAQMVDMYYCTGCHRSYVYPRK